MNKMRFELTCIIPEASTAATDPGMPISTLIELHSFEGKENELYSFSSNFLIPA
jgi:hypothetical protein